MDVAFHHINLLEKQTLSFCVCLCVYLHLSFIEGKPVPAKMDEFTEKVQTAFDPTPPPLVLEFFTANCKQEARRASN